MKFFLVLFLILNFEAAFSKVFEACKFAEELHNRHNIPQKDIYKHFCIGGSFNTKSMSNGYVGIYRIGTEWWCGQEEAGGSCNILCADLLDDDITDDIECMQKIYDYQGLFAWGNTREYCFAQHEQRVADCFAKTCENCLIV